tara:strand:- start:264 stop:431 length:168 start_codon:yes stop_codon:yes gene_type:complete
MIEIIITFVVGLIGGYFLTRYKFNNAHYEEINNIRAHYEVKLLKKNMEDRVREHG